jgi:hypothetical protein
MSEKYVWGLIIQGPIVSYGQGPNNMVSGFNSLESLETNIVNFIPYVNTIVISTWENSSLNFKDKHYNNVFLIENIQPFNDPDNRIKQFTSTYSGAKFISLNSKVTHVLKIRTDQIIDPKIIEWLISFFNKNNNLISKDQIRQENFLIFSDMLKDDPFYMGDFIFAGTVNDILSFCKINLQFNGRNIHPTIGKDYILKYLSKKSSLFWSIFLRRVPLLLQGYNNSVQNYWMNIVKSQMAVIPSSFFWSIKWRGKLMSDIIANTDNQFIFYEDWKVIQQQKESSLKSGDLSYLVLIMKVIKIAKYEYYKYWRTRVIFFFKYLKRIF